LLVTSLVIAACAAAQPETITVVETDGIEKEVGVAGEAGSAEAISVNTYQVELLRAGEVDDNVRWDEYLRYRHNYQGPEAYERNVSERYIIEVNDGQGAPILDAQVSFLANENGQISKIYEAVTYANGQVLFHPRTLGLNLAEVEQFMVQVQKDGLRSQFTLPRFEQANGPLAQPWRINLNRQTRSDSVKLDVLFLIDATGSMADEIHKIQSSIFDVAARIEAIPGQPNVRYGLVTYRDRGESFVSHTYEFTPEVAEFHRNLSTVQADGGGDYPESLNEGLHQAIHDVEWRGQDTIQLIFLVADAPPHLDYANDYDYAVEMEQAARQGIKILPIASSGLDEQGEYIFRQLAQFTQGRFIFLTYEGSTNGGPAGDITTHHVDGYSVANLDDLLVRLVEAELAHQIPQLRQSQSRAPHLNDTSFQVVENLSQYHDATASSPPSLNTRSLVPGHPIPGEVAGVLVGGLLGVIFWVVTGVNVRRDKKMLIVALGVVTLLAFIYFLILA
jgi:Mg-chelatase subunit ChlD